MLPRPTLILALCIAVSGCDSEAPAAGGGPSVPVVEKAAPAQANGRIPGSQTKLLAGIVEDYFEASIELNPVYATFVGDHRYNDRFANNIGPEHRARMQALHREYLAKARRVDTGFLTRQDLLTWDIFVRARELDIEGYDYPSHLLPVSQFFSTPNYVAGLGSGTGTQPFATVEDYDNWIGRADGFAVWMDQAVANMREGMQKGIVQPRVLMEKTLPQLAAHVVEDVEASVFYEPIRNLPENFSSADRDRLTAAYRSMIAEVIVPAYARLHDFIRDEYLPVCRETDGMGALPNGDAWYAYRVRRTTTTSLTPKQIHKIGLDEVARIHGEMDQVIERVGFDGDRDAFFQYLKSDPRFYFTDADELLDGYRALRDVVHPKALALFESFPKADYEIRAVEAFREKSAAAASYRRPSPDGSRPGVFFVNTYDLGARPKWAMESLFLHEAVPGHHFQGATQIELDELPRFRRYGGYTAYSEGWALYAESLGAELGVYTDPYQYFGALAAELWRAIRLVVDTGLHDQGWTREQVLDYMYANAPTSPTRAVSEAERFMAVPAQALAYKVGQLKISELRARAEDKLRSQFDIKAFHEQILGDGALPLDVLEAKVDRWIDSHL